MWVAVGDDHGKAVERAALEDADENFPAVGRARRLGGEDQLLQE